MDRYIQINPKDNVAVALEELAAGEILQMQDRKVAVEETIPAGHKVALIDFSAGDQVVKYGYSIGHVIQNIKAGEWVNEKNLKTSLNGVLDYQYKPVSTTVSCRNEEFTFRGYRRSNGDCGIRNEIWIIPTVGCVNGVVNRLAEQLRRETSCDGVDAIRSFPHNFGCSQLGDDHENTRKILRDMALHPNAGGVLIVGLGCENNQPEAFQKFLGNYDSSRIRFLVCQKEEDEEEKGMCILRELYDLACSDKRTEIPLSELKIT